MDVELVEGAGDFLERTREHRAAEPLLTNVISSVASAVAEARRRYEAYWWWLVRDRGDVVGVAMRTAPHGILLGPMGTDAAAALGAAVATHDPDVPWVNGGVEANAAFRATYLGPGSPVGPRRTRPGQRNLVYEVTTLVTPHAPGRARPALTTDLDLVTDWVQAFHHEIAPVVADSPEVTRAQFAQRIDEGDVWLWEVDGGPVALAGVVGVDDVVSPIARIGPVYTVPAARGRGYGAAVTDALAARELGRGRRVTLYADADYAPSNAAYRKIGFVPRAETRVVWLERD